MRIRINFDKAFTFSTEIPVRIGDINYGGHVGNDSILSILHEARLRFFAQWNFTEMNAGGTGLIMADSAIQYRGEAFYGDVLQIELFANNMSLLSFDLFYKITCTRNNTKLDIAFAKTRLVCFDYQLRKTCEMSSALNLVLNEG